MNDYPNIMGLQLNMLFDDLNDVIVNLGYEELKIGSNNWTLLIKSKHSNKDALGVFIVDRRLYRLIIRDWKDFFDFSVYMSFDNLIDIFQNYFLKEYEYYFYCKYDSRILIYSGKHYEISLDRKCEEIDIMKRK